MRAAVRTPIVFLALLLALPAAGGARGRGPQPSQSWEGVAPVPTVIDLGAHDVYEFEVLAGFVNDLARIEIAWDAGSQVAYDLDLYVDAFDPGLEEWFEVGRSTEVQYANVPNDPVEVVELSSPPPGAYRARVVNSLSTEWSYSGTVTFARIRGRLPGAVG